MADVFASLDGGLKATSNVEGDAGPGGIFLTLPKEVTEHQYVPQAHGGVHQQSTYEKLAYEMGVCFVSGTLGGATLGAVEGYRKAGSVNMKLKMNSMLNAMGRRGSATSNAMSCFALFYVCSHYWIKSQREKDDMYNNIGAMGMAAAITGIPKGPAAVASLGVAGAGLAAAYVYGRKAADEMLGASHY